MLARRFSFDGAEMTDAESALAALDGKKLAPNPP
jgi:hypothetical protein